MHATPEIDGGIVAFSALRLNGAELADGAFEEIDRDWKFVLFVLAEGVVE